VVNGWSPLADQKRCVFLNRIAIDVKEKTGCSAVVNATFAAFRFCLDKGDLHPVKNAHIFGSERPE
jgi:hypothetical protein